MRAVANRLCGVYAAVVACLIAACGSSSPAGLGVQLREQGEPVLTAQDTYVAERGELQVGEETVWYVEVAVDFTYKNPADQPVFLPQCERPLQPRLEKLVDGDWRIAYQPIELACWGPPLELAAGEEYASIAHIRGYDPQSGYLPAWEAAEVDGEYRLVWMILTEPHPDAPPLPLEQRVSNTFQIREAAD